MHASCSESTKRGGQQPRTASSTDRRAYAEAQFSNLSSKDAPFAIRLVVPHDTQLTYLPPYRGIPPLVAGTTILSPGPDPATAPQARIIKSTIGYHPMPQQVILRPWGVSSFPLPFEKVTGIRECTIPIDYYFKSTGLRLPSPIPVDARKRLFDPLG